MGSRAVQDHESEKLFSQIPDKRGMNGQILPRGPRLLDRVRILLRTRHYSYVTEKTYIGWIRRFIHHYQKRHPLDLGPQAIGDYLSYLAIQRSVSAATQNQALNALVFLYREVLEVELEDIPGIEWARKRERIPIVFSKDEVAAILNALPSTQKLIVNSPLF